MTVESKNGSNSSEEALAGRGIYLDRAVEDAERMLNFAAQGKIDDRADLHCLRELAKATAKINKAKDQTTIDENDLSNFYSQLSIMSHILYPVTSESLWVMEGMSRHLRGEKGGKRTFGTVIRNLKTAFCSSIPLHLLVALVVLIVFIVTPLVFSYSIQGSQIVSRLDSAIKERIELKKELVEEGKKYVANSESNNPDPGRIATIINLLEVKLEIMKGLSNQLKQWSESWMSLWVTGIINWQLQPSENKLIPELSVSVKKNSAPRPFLPFVKSDYLDLLERYTLETYLEPENLRRGVKVKDSSLLILQTINNVMLPLLFGFCGAAAFILKKTIYAIQAHTFTGIRCTTWMRLLLGTFCGFFLGFLGSNNDLIQLLNYEPSVPGVQVNLSLVSPLTLAFIGGYSVDLLFGILNRFIYAVTNDDKYLSTSEIIKRKVDVNTFIDKEKLKKHQHPPASPHDPAKGEELVGKESIKPQPDGQSS